MGMLNQLCENDTDCNDPLVTPLLYHFMKSMRTEDKNRLLYRCMKEKLRMLSAPSYKKRYYAGVVPYSLSSSYKKVEGQKQDKEDKYKTTNGSGR